MGIAEEKVTQKLILNRLSPKSTVCPAVLDYRVKTNPCLSHH
jgi:hypothetical protein